MIGALIRKMRIEAQVTQIELARALGVSSAHMSDIELGRRRFNPALAHKLPPDIREAVRLALHDLLEDQVEGKDATKDLR